MPRARGKRGGEAIERDWKGGKGRRRRRRGEEPRGMVRKDRESIWGERRGERVV